MLKQRGDSLVDLLIVFCLFGPAVYWFLIEPYLLDQSLETMKKNPPAVTAEQIHLMDKYKAMPRPVPAPTDTYHWEGSMDGVDLTMTYHFIDDKRLVKEVVLDEKHTLSGAAEFAFDGSVLTFSNITGDKILFPEIGQPISLVNEQFLILHDPKQSLTLKSSTLLAQEQSMAEQAAVDRKAYLESTSLFDMSPEDAYEKVVNTSYFFILTCLVVLWLILTIAGKVRNEYNA